jgi:protein TonB
MIFADREKTLLLGFLTLSLLLHLLLFYLLPAQFTRPATPPQPMMVEVVPPLTPPEPKERELQFAPKEQTEEKARVTRGKRLGERDIVAKKETAPEGKMPEDNRPAAPLPAAPKAKAKPRRQSPPPSSPPLERSRPDTGKFAREGRPLPDGRPQSSPGHSTAPPAKVPDLKSLLQLPPTTVARLEGEWRRKYRPDVEKGDAVWLDTEKDLLISFFQRFKNNIYGVWNYPVQARDRGEQGTCLLRITINRDGTVADVKLMESSGAPSLDQEAISAVRKGAPYGALPRAYGEDTLKIFAFFNYSLTQRVIY